MGGGRAEASKIKDYDARPIQTALDRGIVRLICRDIAFDAVHDPFHQDVDPPPRPSAAPEDDPSGRARRGGVGRSTDTPQEGREDTAGTLDGLSGQVGSSHCTEVAGGIRSEVEAMLGTLVVSDNLGKKGDEKTLSNL
jgi:hypothetical protein